MHETVFMCYNLITGIATVRNVGVFRGFPTYTCENYVQKWIIYIPVIYNTY
jgi:hypothetical protein